MKKPENAFTYYLYRFSDCEDIGIVDTRVNKFGSFTVRVLEGCYITSEAHPNIDRVEDDWFGFSEDQVIKGFNEKQTLSELREKYPEHFL